MTQFEKSTAKKFALDVVGGMDSRDFMDDRNATRSYEKLLMDNYKGKIAEIFMVNQLGRHGVFAEIDMGIYDEGVGDCGDIVVDGKILDVKASSPNARHLMVERDRVRGWETSGSRPDFLCLVGVSDDSVCVYKVGCSYPRFMSKAGLFNRGECIPDTNCVLKADNLIMLVSDGSSDIADLAMAMRGG